jgi:DNA repair exonuclease SbcCD ATPase subunit
VEAHIAELRRNLNEFIADKQRQADSEDSSANELETKLQSAEPLPAPIDVTNIRAKLDTAKATNAAIALRNQRDRTNGEAEKLEAEAEALTARMAAREEEKLTAIKSAKMPLDELGFGDGYITYDGLPFDQASDAEQLRVSAAIAMAGNPKLKVIRIRDGSLLDEDSLQMLANMARERGYQVWIERVDSSGKVGIVMEDGMVKSC